MSEHRVSAQPDIASVRGGIPEETAAELVLTGKKIEAPRVLAYAVAATFLLLILFEIFNTAFPSIDIALRYRITLTLVLVAVYLVRPLGKKSWKSRFTWHRAIDILFVILLIGAMVYVTLDWEAKRDRYLAAAQDYVLAAIIVVLLLEATRRTVGWVLVIVCLGAILYCRFNAYLPPPLFGPSLDWGRLVELVYMKETGIYGIAADILSRTLMMFFVLSAFLHATHIGDVFIKIANAVAGRFTGGPAKIAVIASSLLGTATGSAIANVVGTGTFTIPMMKRYGFEPHFAAAVEATASTGSQIMPPVMAAAAFLVAAFLGVSYLDVIVAATVPAIGYYVCVFMQVHARAVKLGLKGLPRNEVPPLGPSLVQAWPIVLCLMTLVFFLFRAYDVGKCGLYAVGVLVVASFFVGRTRLTASSVLIALEYAGRLTLQVGVAMGAVGIVIGCFQASGLSTELARTINAVSGGNLLVIALITGIVALILGMGLGTTVVYVTLYMIALPALTQAGANPMAAHLFCLYYAVINCITPPVALAAYAAAALADAPVTKTAISATRLGVASFIVPLAFLYNPEILLVGKATDILVTLLFFFTGCLHMSMGIESYLWGKANRLQRVLLILGSLACLTPMWSVRAAGLSAIALSYIQLFIKMRANRRGKLESALTK